MYYSNYLQEKKDEYIKHSKTVTKKTVKFVEKLQVFNKKTGEVSNLKYDINKIKKDDYLWAVFQSVALQNHVNTLNDDYIGLFLTLTVPSKFHPYTTHKNGKKLDNPIFNKNFDKDKNFNEAYNLLNFKFREIYKNFRPNNRNKAGKIYFQKVVEPHKTFVPHLHGVLYVKKEHKAEFLKHLENLLGQKSVYVDKKTSKKYNRKKLKDTEKWGFKGTDKIGSGILEVMEDTKKTSTYLLKYLKKTLEPGARIDTLILDGWKKKNKIRIYTYSQGITIPRYIFKTVSQVLNIKDLKENENILEVIGDLIEYETKMYSKGEYIGLGATHKGSKSKYIVDIEMDRTTTKLTTKKYDEFDKMLDDWYYCNTRYKDKLEQDLRVKLYKLFDENNVMCSYLKHTSFDLVQKHYWNNFEIENMESEKEIYKYQYSIKKFIIKRKSDNKIIYDKSNYVLLNELNKDDYIA